MQSEKHRNLWQKDWKSEVRLMARRGTTKFKSNKQEKSVSKELNGRTVVGSGSRWFADSDVKTDKFLVECKTTAKNYFSVTTELWEKIEREATKDHMRIPLMVIDLNNDSVHESERYVVFKYSTFGRLPCQCAGTLTLEGIENAPKSYRITSGYLDNLDDAFGYKVFGKLFDIASTKKRASAHILFYMRMDDFKKFYKKELEE